MKRSSGRRHREGHGLVHRGDRICLGSSIPALVALVKTIELSPSQCWPVLGLGMRTDRQRDQSVSGVTAGAM